jgi:S1-C subfamily serine protease
MSRLPALLAATALAIAPAAASADDTSIWSAIKARITEAGVQAAAKTSVEKPKDSNVRLGVQVVPITPELRAHYGSTDGRGVLVGHVDLGSPAQLAGLEVGDLLLDLGGTKVTNPADVVSALAGIGGPGTLPATVLRDHQRHELTLRLDRPIPLLGELVRVFTISQPTCT